jgi:replicative DNA helicase
LMLEEEAIDHVADMLTAECFYKEDHRVIFKAISDLAANHQEIDMMVVTQKLKDAGNLEKVGGPYQITQLTAKVSSAAHIQHHARIIYEKYIQREMIKASSLIMNAAYNEDFDTTQTVFENGIYNLDLLLSGGQTMAHLRQVLKQHAVELSARKERSSAGVSGANTGLESLNRRTMGWQPGSLIIVAARPSMGKTALALKEVVSAAKGDTPVCVFSLETTSVKLSDRLICAGGGIDMKHLQSGNLTDNEWKIYNQNVRRLEELPIFIDDSAYQNVARIRSICRAKHRKGECGMIVIDYLQLISTPEEQSKYMNREREVAIITRSLKILAKELNIPIILLCQLNRSVESRADKRPMMSDLRESGSIEQDADVIIFPHRPWYYGIENDEEGKSWKGILVLITAKNKDGEIGDDYCKHSKDMTTITDLYDDDIASADDVEKGAMPVANWYEKKDDQPF